MPTSIRSSGEAQVMNFDASTAAVNPKPAVGAPVPPTIHLGPVVHPSVLDAVHPEPAAVPDAVHPKPTVPDAVHPKPTVPDAVHPKPAVPDAVHPNPAVKTTAPDSPKIKVHPAAKQAPTVASPNADIPNAIPGGPTAKPQPSFVHPAPIPPQAPVPALPHGHTKHWPNDVTMLQTGVLVSLPIIFCAAFFIVLKIVWKSSRSSPRYAPTSTHENESTPLQKDISLTQKGANTYGQGCLQKFEIVFLVGMALTASVLTLLTYFYEYHLLHSTHFWLLQVLKFAILMVIALCGGSLCRHCCEIDVRGYTVMIKSNRFRVDYTRKFHLFATYLLFLAVKVEHRTLLGLAWGAFFCLLTFLVLIKPIREKSTFFMLQFNSLDCPEDRPDTLQRIIALNLVPGMLILLFFVWLLAEKASLLFILVLVTGVGVGLADTIGTTLGTHAYKSRECFSWRVHMHTLEGSAYVFLAAMIFPLLQYSYFSSFLQVLLAMLLLPPVMTLVEATSLQACKIPALLISGGAIIYVLTVFA